MTRAAERAGQGVLLLDVEPPPLAPLDDLEAWERRAVVLARELPGWIPRDRDVVFVRELFAQFPGVQIVNELSRCGDWMRRRNVTSSATGGEQRVRNWLARTRKTVRAGTRSAAPRNTGLARSSYDPRPGTPEDYTRDARSSTW